MKVIVKDVFTAKRKEDMIMEDETCLDDEKSAISITFSRQIINLETINMEIVSIHGILRWAGHLIHMPKERQVKIEAQNKKIVQQPTQAHENSRTHHARRTSREEDLE